MKKANKKISREEKPRNLKSGEYNFYADVYDVVRQIPKGRVTSYGAIAQYLGTKMSARMVGWALNSAQHVHPRVPAQRVVNRNGMLTGKMHFSTPTEMEALLKKEKVFVKDEVVVDFEKKFWDPSKELTLK